jgi:heme oxygenase
MLPALKTATAGHHARVEALMPSLDELATPDGYAAALRALHAFHAAWEPALWRAPGLAGAGLDPAVRRKQRRRGTERRRGFLCVSAFLHESLCRASAGTEGGAR